MAKYFEITKAVYKTSSDWHLHIKDTLSVQGSRMHYNKLAEKITDYLNGDADEIRHSKKRYHISETTFKADGHKVYMVSEDGIHPCFIYYRMGEKWEIDTGAIIDEDMALFEKYGYTVTV